MDMAAKVIKSYSRPRPSSCLVVKRLFKISLSPNVNNFLKFIELSN